MAFRSVKTLIPMSLTHNLVASNLPLARKHEVSVEAMLPEVSLDLDHTQEVLVSLELDHKQGALMELVQKHKQEALMQMTQAVLIQTEQETA